jgi:N-acetyl-anhydromuramyl-L-alanine amidase AmpD
MRPSKIVLHHSLTKDGQTVSWDNIRRYHVDDLHWREIGYHYGIEKVDHGYEIFVGRMMTMHGAHCKQQGMNTKSLGICFVGNFDEEKPSEEQWDLGVRLVRSLCEVFAIPVHEIYGHDDFAPHKTCPGRLFDVAAFREAVVGAP